MTIAETLLAGSQWHTLLRPGAHKLSPWRRRGLVAGGLWWHADEALDHVAAFEDHQRGNAADAVVCAAPGLSSMFSLPTLTEPRYSAASSSTTGADHAAGTAPGSPKVDQDRLRRLKNFLLKVGVGEFGGIAHGSLLLCAGDWRCVDRRYPENRPGAAGQMMRNSVGQIIGGARMSTNAAAGEPQ